MGAFLQVNDVFKSYFLNGKRIDVLNGVTVSIERGELVSLIGASDSGCHAPARSCRRADRVRSRDDRDT